MSARALSELPSYRGYRYPAEQRRAKERWAAGPLFVIYHGEVSQDSDGPVEVCVPIGLAQERSTDAAMRREPTHREAYVRLTKAQ